MTDEPDLFGVTPPAEYPDAPGHRGVDTSIAAAADIAPKLGRLQRLAEETIRAAGPVGLTADELAERVELPRWTMQPRTTELRIKGLVVDSGTRAREGTAGQPAVNLIVIAVRPGSNDSSNGHQIAGVRASRWSRRKARPFLTGLSNVQNRRACTISGAF